MAVKYTKDAWVLGPMACKAPLQTDTQRYALQTRTLPAAARQKPLVVANCCVALLVGGEPGSATAVVDRQCCDHHQYMSCDHHQYMSWGMAGPVRGIFHLCTGKQTQTDRMNG